MQAMFLISHISHFSIKKIYKIARYFTKIETVTFCASKVTLKIAKQLFQKASCLSFGIEIHFQNYGFNLIGKLFSNLWNFLSFCFNTFLFTKFSEFLRVLFCDFLDCLLFKVLSHSFPSNLI